MSRPSDNTPVNTIQSDTSIKTYLALGDSYTIGHDVPADQRYPLQTAKLALQSGVTFATPYIIATNGWTTENLISAIDNHSGPILPHYDMVTLLIGVNDQYQGALLSDYKTNFLVLLKKAIAFAGNQPSHVIVLSIPDYGVTPFGKGSRASADISSQIDQFNAANRQLSTDYEVNYVDITGETRRAASDASYLAPDGLHYSGKEYAIWASMLVPVLTKILR